MNGQRNHSKLKILRLLGNIFRFVDSIDLNCVDGGFPQREVLEMKHLALRKWELGNGSMRRLQSCKKLDNLPTELCSLNGLRKVHITEPPSEQMAYIL